jgi:hypothetical protein
MTGSYTTCEYSALLSDNSLGHNLLNLKFRAECGEDVANLKKISKARPRKIGGDSKKMSGGKGRLPEEREERGERGERVLVNLYDREQNQSVALPLTLQSKSCSVFSF